MDWTAKRMERARLLGTVLVTAWLAWACSSSEGIPPLEIQAQAINQTVMCPVCPGESIDQSQHPLAVQMRGIVADKLQEGRTADEIKAYFVEGYGPSVLLEPPRTGFSLVVWVVPPVGVALAALALFAVLRSMSRRDETEVAREALSPEERDRYFHQIETAQAEGRGSDRGPEGVA